MAQVLLTFYLLGRLGGRGVRCPRVPHRPRLRTRLYGSDLGPGGDEDVAAVVPDCADRGPHSPFDLRPCDP